MKKVQDGSYACRPERFEATSQRGATRDARLQAFTAHIGGTPAHVFT